MSGFTYPQDNLSVVRARTDWGSIWAGVFSFFAIWSVFGMLGVGVFSSAASPNAANPILGMHWGEGAWIIILTTIAMYVAARFTSRLARVSDRQDGIKYGITMFGLSVVGFTLLIFLAELVTGIGTTVTAATSYTLGIASTLGWMLFVALFLGFIGAIVGGMQGSAGMGVSTQRESVPAEETTRRIRPAA